MNLKTTLALLISFTTSLTAFAQNRDAVLGIWQSEHGNARIQIFKSGENYNGKIIWLKEELDEAGRQKTDKNNPSELLRSKPIIGLEALSDFTYTKEGVWEGGKVYDPRSGKKYDCKLSLSTDNQLEVRAFMGISLIGKTQVWTKIK